MAAVAEALHFTPSAVSQQLAVLEREAGVTLFERVGRSVRLTDAALVLAGHAAALLDRAGRAEADLAAAAGHVAGRGRIASFQSMTLRLAIPAMRALADAAPGLRCELVESEPEASLPQLALGDVDVVLGDEWVPGSLAWPRGLDRRDLWEDPVRLVLPAGHPAARRHPGAVPLAELAGDTWATGHPVLWDEMVVRTCRQLGGFTPDVRHTTNDSVTALALVAGTGAVTLLPDLVRPEAHAGVVVRPVAGADLHRTLFVATRTVDAARPSVRALLGALGGAARALGWPPRLPDGPPE
jgi:DNA-binding transcriptional LysR family regulator